MTTRGAAASSSGDVLADMKRQMAALQAKLAQFEQAAPSAAAAAAAVVPEDPALIFAALFRSLQEGQAAQAAAMQQMAKQQATAASSAIVLKSLGDLPSFTGKGADTTLIASEWLQSAEHYYAARERAQDITALDGDQVRVLQAVNALQDDARRWYNAIPQPRPNTWALFRSAVESRFCSVPAERIRVDRLHEFVEKSSKLRASLNLQGIQAITTRFAQLVGEVPPDYLTEHAVLGLLARILPQRCVKVVMLEDAKKPLPKLHEVVNKVLARASADDQAAAY